MMTICKKSKEVYACLGVQECVPWEKYKLSIYTYVLKIDDGILLYNLLTRQMVLITDSIEDDMHDLIKNWFFVPTRVDEYSMVYSFWQKFYTSHPRMRHPLRNVVIFTTTECNANCAYCYERGSSINRMTPETAEKAADYIIREAKEKVHLKWFGGEPLINTEVIDIICNRLKDAGIKYNSDMTTNGYLFSMVSNNTLMNIWNLKHIQVTIDGTKPEYERIKGIKGLYDVVIEAIDRLARLGVDVSIRTHATKDNLDDLIQLVHDLAEHFRGTIIQDKVHMYATAIYEDPNDPLTDEDRDKVYDNLITVCNTISELKMGRPKMIQEVQGNHCMADSDCGIVIAPTGALTPCEHYHDAEIVGNVEDGGSIPAKWYEPTPEHPECRTCFYYPQCKKLNLCDGEAKCNDQYIRFIRYSIEQIMLNEYQVFIENGRHPLDVQGNRNRHGRNRDESRRTQN